MSLTRLRRADSRLLLALVCVACAAVVAPAATADVDKGVGPRLSLNGSVSTFPAGQPFHIASGWGTAPGQLDQSIGLWTYKLTIDGVPAQPSFIQTTVSQDPVYGTVLGRVSVFNFPSGMSGTHVFGSTFLGPCKEMVHEGFRQAPALTRGMLSQRATAPFSRPSRSVRRAAKHGEERDNLWRRTKGSRAAAQVPRVGLEAVSAGLAGPSSLLSGRHPRWREDFS